MVNVNRERLGKASMMVSAVAALVLLGQKPAAATPISSLPVTLSVPGTYELTGNLATAGFGPAINITADDVVVDGKGFTIRGPGWGGSNPKSIGVQVVGRKRAQIRNIGLTRFTHGIRTLPDAAGKRPALARILRVRAFGNWSGLHLAYADESSVTGSRFDGNTWGIYVAYSNRNLFTGNLLTSNFFRGSLSGAYYLGRSAGNVIKYDTMSRNGAGVYLYTRADANTIDACSITENASSGVAARGCANNRILDNHICWNQQGIDLASGVTGHLVQQNRVLSSATLDMFDGNLPSAVNTWTNNRVVVR